MSLPETLFDYEAHLAACARGERAALHRLYVQEGPRLLSVAKRLVRDTALAEDVVHDAFIKIWNGAAGFDPARGSARGWMFSVTRHLALNLLTQTTPKPSYLVVLVAPQDKAPGWVIQASNAREIQLIPLGVVEVPADKALEFWTKADGWQGPVSLGLVKPGQALSVPLDELPPLQPNQLFELTLEGANGSPIGKPTGPIQAIGRVVKVL